MERNHDAEVRPAAGPANQTERQFNPASQQISNSNTSSQSVSGRRSQRAAQSIIRHHPTLHNTLPRNIPSRIPPLPQRPRYSLAGNFGLQAHSPSYIDPKYYDYNPSYQKDNAAPVWGLAKPLPRVVRPGMRKAGHKTGEDGDVVKNKGAGIDAPGSAEVIPQLGMIEDQKQEEGKESIENQPSNEGRRGYGHQLRQKQARQDSRRNNAIAGRAASESNILDRFGTPNDEKANLLEEWRRPISRRSLSPEPDLFNDARGDLGDRIPSRLSSLLEVPTGSKDVDLESGINADDWPLENQEAEEYMREEEDMHNSWASIRARFREPLAECLATMIAVLIGLSTNLAVQTSNSTKGTYLSANWAWGLGITIGIYIAGGISGGHLNPAISLTLCIYRGFPLRKAGIYISAQLLGALMAGLLAYGIYKDAIFAFDSSGGATGATGGSTHPVDLYAGGTGIAFYTQPAKFAGAGAAFANEFLATAILSCAILALGDDSNAPPGAGMHAFIVGLLVTALTMAFGYNTGACLNPARDLGPRLATAIVGYGRGVFTVRDAWWIYGAWGATISGALVGGGVYDVAIFVGGESPVNYPRGKRRRASRKVKEGVKRKWWLLRKDVKRGAKGDLGKEG